MNVDELGVVVLGSSLVLLLAVGAVRLSTRTGTPSLLLYLGLGILLGESGLGIVFEDFELTYHGDDAEGWLCIPKGRSEHAARMRLKSEQGRTPERAAKKVERGYLEARYGYKEAERRIPQMTLFAE